jgi:hypothetical protein
VALVRTDVSEERVVSIIRVKRITELRTALLVAANDVPSSLIRVTPMTLVIHSSEMSVLT